MFKLADLLNVATTGDAGSNLLAAATYEHGWGVGADSEKARRHYAVAAQSGSESAVYWFANFLLGSPTSEGDAVEAVELLKSIASKDFAPAHDMLANCFEFGIGTAAAPDIAFSWRCRAAELGFAPAQEYLALMYAEGIGTHKDAASAFVWYKRAAENKLHGSALHVADMLERGDGVPKDEEGALTWYTRAADLGSASAHRRLAWAFETGSLGLRRDKEKQARHLDKALALEQNPSRQFDAEAALPFDPYDKQVYRLTRARKQGPDTCFAQDRADQSICLLGLLTLIAFGFTEASIHWSSVRRKIVS